MQVKVTNTIKKREYEYKTISLRGGLKGWEIEDVWNYGPNARLDEQGKLTIVVRKAL